MNDDTINDSDPWVRTYTGAYVQPEGLPQGGLTAPMDLLPEQVPAPEPVPVKKLLRIFSGSITAAGTLVFGGPGVLKWPPEYWVINASVQTGAAAAPAPALALNQGGMWPVPWPLGSVAATTMQAFNALIVPGRAEGLEVTGSGLVAGMAITVVVYAITGYNPLWIGVKI